MGFAALFASRLAGGKKKKNDREASFNEHHAREASAFSADPSDASCPTSPQTNNDDADWNSANSNNDHDATSLTTAPTTPSGSPPPDYKPEVAQPTHTEPASDAQSEVTTIRQASQNDSLPTGVTFDDHHHEEEAHRLYVRARQEEQAADRLQQDQDEWIAAGRLMILPMSQVEVYTIKDKQGKQPRADQPRYAGNYSGLVLVGIDDFDYLANDDYDDDDDDVIAEYQGRRIAPPAKL